MTLPVITVVAAILENEEGNILLAQRPRHKTSPGLWEFPGGKVETNETPEDATVRELEEELGLITSSQHLKPFTFVSLEYHDFHIILLCFLCSQWSGTPQPQEGQEGIEWVSPGDLEKYPMREANQAVIPLLKNRIQPKSQVKCNVQTLRLEH